MALTAVLNIWSGYSLLRSAWPMERGLQRLAEAGIRAVGLADYETMAGVERFHRLARGLGLRTWLGVTRLLDTPAGPAEVRLYALSPQGFSHLCRQMEERRWEAVVEGDLLLAAPAWLLHEARRGGWLSATVTAVEAVAPGERPKLDGPWLPDWPVRYLDPQDQDAYHLLCQMGGQPHAAGARPTPSLQDLAQAFSGPGQSWWDNPPERVLPESRLRLPQVLATPEREARWLRQLALRGLRARYGPSPPAEAPSRLDYELSVVGELGLAGYFLMVADLVRAARRMGVRVGPGRGSVGGSLIAYCLGITEVDPLRWGLVFERFLNPQRANLPDIDIDLDWERRGEVLAYVRRRWKDDRVAQIGTYGTLGPRAAVREVGRMLGVAPAELDRRMARAQLDPSRPLGEQLEALAEVVADHPLAERWQKASLILEGLPHHASVHAAGVVISPEPLVGALPLYRGEAGWVTQMEMESVERLGWVKLDLLGLRTLAVVEAVERYTGERPRLESLDPADPATLKLLAAGDTESVFQLDGAGVRTLLRAMRPRHLGEVMDVVALWRPGPMEHVGEYLAARERGGTAEADPVAALCRDTYGVLVYQEQLMAVVRELGGYSWAEADLFRQAVSKKDRARLEAATQTLQERLIARGMPVTEAEAVVRRILAFADYGFNRAHAAAYGLLAYYLAYLKAHHPDAFWAAELSTLSRSATQRKALEEAVASGHPLRLPHVNLSEAGFLPEQGAIRVGLGQIRGVGWEMARRVVEERRRGGPYRSPEELLRRLGKGGEFQLLHHLEAAGALFGLGAKRTAAAQLQFFDLAADEEPTQAPERVHAPSALGWPWPQAFGPLYVKVAPGEEASVVQEAVVDWARKHPGTESLVLATGGGRGRMLGVKASSEVSAVQALKAIPGVEAVRRRVAWNEWVQPGQG